MKYNFFTIDIDGTYSLKASVDLGPILRSHRTGRPDSLEALQQRMANIIDSNPTITEVLVQFEGGRQYMLKKG